MIEAVAFDLDGVLIDSEPVWERVRRGLVEEFGRPYPPNATADIMGMSAPEWSRYLHDRLGVPLEPERINAEVVRRVAAEFRRTLPLLPNATETVRALAARWPLAVASSSNRSLIELALQLAQIESSFRAIVSSEEVPNGKPAPDVYLRAAALLGSEPPRCAAIEDSTNGIRSAAAARMFVVAIPNRHFPPAPDALARANLVLDALGELTPQRLEAALREPPADPNRE